jgi:hypothetical protein
MVGIPTGATRIYFMIPLGWTRVYFSSKPMSLLLNSLQAQDYLSHLNEKSKLLVVGLGKYTCLKGKKLNYQE